MEKWLCLPPLQRVASSLRSSLDLWPGLLPPAPPSGAGGQMSALIVPEKCGASTEEAEKATHRAECSRVTTAGGPLTPSS